MNSQTKSPLTLPGAEQFFEYLQSLYPSEDIEIKQQRTWEYGEKPHELDMWWYTLLNQGVCIGEYKAWPSPKGGANFTREYKGQIPGCIYKTSNKPLPEILGLPDGWVSLVFSDMKFDSSSMRLIQTPWQRQDDYSTIPFP